MQTDSFKQLIERNIEADLQLLRRAGGLLRNASDLVGQPGRRSSADTKAFLSDLMSLNLDFYARLSEQSIQYLNAVVSLAESVLERPQPAPAGGVSAGEIALSGRLGETVSGHFKLDNDNDQPVTVEFETLQLESSAGDRIGSECIQFTPPAATIAPRSALTVAASIHLDKRFAAGQTYRTAIRVTGFPGKQIHMTVRVLDDSTHAGPHVDVRSA